MTIAIMAILSQTIVEPLDAPAYVDRETEVQRFADDTLIVTAMELMYHKYPAALAFEVYRPITDATAMPRY